MEHLRSMILSAQVLPRPQREEWNTHKKAHTRQYRPLTDHRPQQGPRIPHSIPRQMPGHNNRVQWRICSLHKVHRGSPLHPSPHNSFPALVLVPLRPLPPLKWAHIHRNRYTPQMPKLRNLHPRLLRNRKDRNHRHRAHNFLNYIQMFHSGCNNLQCCYRGHPGNHNRFRN